MGSMADEMRTRMEADGGAGLPGGDGGAAPGNEGVPPTPAAPPAGESNADTAADRGAPETIPYARFKEVNDRLAPYRELEGFGYDADSLRQLAAFETSYLQDPYGTVITMAENLDLPQDVVDSLKASVPGADATNGRAEGGTPSPDGAAPALPKEVQAKLDYVDRLQEREAEAMREAQLNTVVEAWDQMDKEEGIETPARIKLMAIASAAGSGQQFRTHEDLARSARESINEFRGEVLGSSVRTGRGGTTPPALPSGAPPASGPIKFKSIREATKAAEAAIAHGDLPPIDQ